MIDRKLSDLLVDAYVDSIPLITLNIIWFITSLPLITLIPATAALFYATNRLAHGHSADWRTFFEGFRLYFWRSWLWGLLNVLVIGVVISNIIFYGLGDSTWVILARVMIIVLSALWFALQIYTFPLIIEQEKPLLRLALRNSAVIILKRPLYTLGVMVAIALLAVGTTILLQPAWIIITASLCAFLANQAAVKGIAASRGEPADSPEQPE